jgi:hypothetical protein
VVASSTAFKSSVKSRSAVLRPLPYLLLCKSLQLSNRRVNTSGNGSPLAQPARLAPITCRSSRAKKIMTAASVPTTRSTSSMSHSVANVQFFLFFILPVGCTKFAYPRLHRCIPGGTVHSFQPVLIPIDWSFVQISVSTKSCPTTNHRHGRLLRVKRHGSSHHHRPDLVRHRLLGPKHVLTTECRSKLYIAAR